MRTRWLSATSSHKPIHFVKALYSHRTCRASPDERDDMFNGNCDAEEVKSTKVAMSIWATQLVGAQCMEEVGNLGCDDPKYVDARHPGFRAHVQVSVNERMKSKRTTVTEDDITSFSMQRTIEVLQYRAPTAWFLTECMAARRDQDNEVVVATRRPHPFIQAAALSMFAITRNRSANGYFALPFGVWLFSSNAHTNVKRIMSRLGLSVHDITVREALVSIATARKALLQQLTAASLNTRQPFCKITLDNIQKYRIVREHGIGRSAEMMVGTAGLATRLNNCAPDSFHLEPYRIAVAKNERAQLTTALLHNDVDFQHLNRVFSLHVVHVLCSHVPELTLYLKAIAERFATEPVVKHRMPCEKTDIFALSTNGHNEMETAEMKATVKDLDGQVGYTSDNVASAAVLLWNAGDVGSFLAFWRALRHLLPQAATLNAYESFENRFFTPGMFHTRMHFLEEMANVFFGPKTSKDPSALGHSAMATGLHIPNPSGTVDFYPTERTMDTIFDAQILDLWSLKIANHSDLRSYFTAAAAREELPTLDALIKMADGLVTRYASSRAFDAAMSTARQTSCSESLKFPVAAGPTMASDEFSGDRSLSNSIQFKQQFLLYRELTCAVKEGDTGRILEALKLLIFIFAGANKQNYTTAFMEIYCMFRYEASPSLKNAILDNWLVNTMGQPGKFLEDDHLQEHHIRLLTDMMSGNVDSFDESFFRNTISPNVRLFLDNKEAFDRTFELKAGGKAHTSPDVKDETRVLLKMYRDEKLHYFKSGRDFGHTAKNMINLGYKSLDGGKMHEFQANSTNRANVLRTLRKINVEPSPPVEPLSDPMRNRDDSSDDSDSGWLGGEIRDEEGEGNGDEWSTYQQDSMAENMEYFEMEN
ncbi:hypothetical protein FB45DRAFT_766471 [Roridomyces roridus]|uniref:DUF6589 domain-containing protein n=1 Tax=Roridomyces roridus TaxID=1738132 RepID=A0AAD7F9M6_9AGAR|nr:hypothetical protein FB45DRAFT_766471 [Roridomyces roridus]